MAKTSPKWQARRLRYVLFVPEDPRGKDAVEKRLDERGAEEVFALLGLELHAKRFFQRGADGGELRQILRGFHA